jgi:predicted AAA+ superfamily ATPase
VPRLKQSELYQWKSQNNRKPLLLKGARQVGKTFLIKQFGKENFANYHYFNFEKQTSILKIFDENLEPKKILAKLEVESNQKINIKSDLIIFDEIQACPRALTSLKYFSEDLPDVFLIAAGSLLGLFLNEVSFPVGKVSFLNIGPFNFREFLRALNVESLLDEMFNNPSEYIHSKLWQYWKEYLVVGGLPEVVMAFQESRSLSTIDCYHKVNVVQENLVNSYVADMAKHSGKINSMHIERLWRNIPAQLAQEQSRRFLFKDIIPKKNRYSELVDIIDWLDKAELIYRVPIIDKINLPLVINTQENLFKLFIFDCGILNFLTNLEFRNILSYDFGYYKGYIAENFALHELKRMQSAPIYNWMTGQAEIDFMLQLQGMLTPIEVKSGNNPKAKSLLNFMRSHPKILRSYRFTGRGYINKEGVLVAGKNGRIYDCPIYLISEMLNH